MLVMSPLIVSNAVAAEATGYATAEVITPAAITPVSDLWFGDFSAKTAGAVVISEDGSVSATGGIVLSAARAGKAATLLVDGHASATWTITLPPDAVMVHESDHAQTIRVRSLTSSPASTDTLGAAGAQTVTVGGTLSVPDGQRPGRYSGAFDIVVEYN